MQGQGLLGFPAATMPLPSQGKCLTGPSGFATASGMEVKKKGSLATTWDLGARTANVTLSNGNLTATSSSATYESARTTRSHGGGKYHFEITCGSSAFLHGLCNASHILTNTLGVTTDNNSIEYELDGKVYANNVLLASGIDTFTNGSKLAFEVDLDAKQLWVQKLGGTGRKGPYSYTIAGPLFPACGLNGSGDSAVFNGGSLSAFAIAPTTGFASWDSQ